MASKAGKPLKWSTPLQLEEYIQEYYKWADENNKHITITGLAWWLDTNRQTLINYENAEENNWLIRCSDEDRKKYIDTIKKAKTYIEMEAEERLYDRGKVTGSIFSLKNNFKWVDKQEIEHTNNNISVELTD